MAETTFENAQVGDKVWDVKFGDGVVTHIFEDGSTIWVVFKDDGTCQFSSDGRQGSRHNRTLFWAPVEIIAPPRPKRKVKKTVEVWRNIYPGGERFASHSLYVSRELADASPFANERIACVKLTGEYEVEE